ncbi:MAG: DHH family phosphoesterase [Nanoarchaeota archaeon]
MINVIKLENNRTIIDLKVNACYLGLYKNGMIQLNNVLRTRVQDQLEENRLYPVKISKIELPDRFHVQVLQDSYELMKEKQHADQLDLEIDVKIGKYRPETSEFTLKHDALEKLKPKFVQAATMIRSALSNKVPILIRHHADCDGYAAALCLERAIYPLLEKEHREHTYRFYQRSPSKTPFYDYVDATKDIESFIRACKRFAHRTPLIIVVDMGSGEENILSLNKLQIFEPRIIVIDHHYAGEIVDGKAPVCRIANVHLNPFLVNSDSRFCAGILCYELARMVNKKTELIDFIPALAGIGDKVELYEQAIQDHYFQLAKNAGYEEDYLRKLAKVIDFEASAVKFLDIDNIMNDLFGEDKENQEKLVTLISHEIEERVNSQKEAIRKYAAVTEKEKFRLIILDIAKITVRSEYPGLGKTVGISHELFSGKQRITIGRMEDGLIFRCDGVVGFDVNKIIKEAGEKFPYALVSGGGHACAGSLNFIPAAAEEVFGFVMEWIEKLA